MWFCLLYVSALRKGDTLGDWLLSGLFVGHDHVRGSRQAVFQKLAGRVGCCGRCSRTRVSGRIGSGLQVFESHGSGRVILTNPREETRPVKNPGYFWRVKAYFSLDPFRLPPTFFWENY